MISLDELKLHLKAEDTTADDELIADIEQSAVAFMENETGEYYGPVVELTDEFMAGHSGPYYLRATPVLDDPGQPFTIERRYSFGEAYEVVPSTEYEIVGRRIFLAQWADPPRSLRVSYYGGYAEGDEPAEVRLAVRELVTKMYEQRSPVVIGTIAAELPMGLRRIIEQRRAPVC